MLLLATEDGIFRVTGASADLLGLKELVVHSIVVHPDDPHQILAASPGDTNPGVFLSQDAGRTFRQTLFGYVHAMGWYHQTARVYAGLRGFHLVASADGGEQWQEIDVTGVRSQLPPPHFAGHPYDVLSLIAKPPYMYTGIEAGGVVFSHDGGKSFRLAVHYPSKALAGPHQDVHAMAIDPWSAPQLDETPFEA